MVNICCPFSGSGSSFVEGSLLCGNHAYDDGPGEGPLRGTPLAHAEMNPLGAARTDWDLSALTLWSTQEPCSMCTAAAAFTGVGTDAEAWLEDLWHAIGDAATARRLRLES
ncbi:deaminase [Streptomyces rubiginosohelvolus]|uniref:deaminase n=1 Tax=Streptomyces rubiginosohelvolus TaxID=67362 RepID=UPI0035DF6778